MKAAVAENRYQVATCQYVYGNTGRTRYFWSANAPLPSAEVQAYAKGVIDAPRKSCPADAK